MNIPIDVKDITQDSVKKIIIGPIIKRTMIIIREVGYIFSHNIMKDLEKVGIEVERVEMRAWLFQNLENLDMYEDGIFEMVNYDVQSSGLPYSLWFDDAGEWRENKHKEPRVKAELPSNNLIPISIEEKPGLLLEAALLTKAESEIDWEKMNLIFAFISRNHKLLLQHWNGEVDCKDLLNNLVRD